MTDTWLSVKDARGAEGFRLVLMRGFPSPWSVAARWMFELKDVEFQKVERTDGDRAEDQLRAWTGQDSLPAAMVGDERPRTHWYDIALLADRLKAEPRMVPDDAGLRARLAGLGNELLGEQGLIWCIRALALVPRAADEPRLASFAFKYGGSPAEMARAPERIRSILDLLAAVIREQKARGSEYLVGDALSAIDLYWSAASVLLRPEAAFGLPEEAIAVAQGFAALAGDVADDLIEHRDRMFERYYSLPLRLE